MIVRKLDENHTLDTFFKCDNCGNEITMGYFTGSYPPKPWTSKEVKQGGFYLLKHFCKNCSDM